MRGEITPFKGKSKCIKARSGCPTNMEPRRGPLNYQKSILVDTCGEAVCSSFKYQDTMYAWKASVGRNPHIRESDKIGLRFPRLLYGWRKPKL